MYLLRTEFTVPAGSDGAFEARRANLGELAKGTAGYLGQTLLHSYSYPAKYVVTSRWENVEAAWAFRGSDVMAKFVKEGGPGSLVHQEGYESVFEVDADGLQGDTSKCEVLTDWTLKGPGVAADFERSRREFFELRKKHANGFVSNRLRRSSGVPTRYLALNIYTDADAARASGSAAVLQAWNSAHPYTAYADAPPTIEGYYAVFRMQR